MEITLQSQLACYVPLWTLLAWNLGSVAGGLAIVTAICRQVQVVTETAISTKMCYGSFRTQIESE